MKEPGNHSFSRAEPACIVQHGAALASLGTAMLRSLAVLRTAVTAPMDLRRRRAGPSERRVITAGVDLRTRCWGSIVLLVGSLSDGLSHLISIPKQ